MSRVPDVPPKPVPPIRRLWEFQAGGYRLISHCSSGAGHQHELDYDALIGELGDVEVDYPFKRSRTCPECGVPGGGMTIRQDGSA